MGLGFVLKSKKDTYKRRDGRVNQIRERIRPKAYKLGCEVFFGKRQNLPSETLSRSWPPLPKTFSGFSL